MVFGGLIRVILGNRGDYELSAGPKVLLVADGGTLELHGKKKLSWTKLSKTVKKIENTDSILYDHLVSSKRLYINEPPRGKTNNVVSEQVRHKPTCTSTEKS